MGADRHCKGATASLVLRQRDEDFQSEAVQSLRFTVLCKIWRTFQLLSRPAMQNVVLSLKSSLIGAMVNVEISLSFLLCAQDMEKAIMPSNSDRWAPRWTACASGNCRGWSFTCLMTAALSWEESSQTDAPVAFTSIASSETWEMTTLMSPVSTLRGRLNAPLNVPVCGPSVLSCTC